MKPNSYFWVVLVFSRLQGWCLADNEPRHQIAIAFNLDGLPIFQISQNVSTTPAPLSSVLQSSDESILNATFAPTEFNLFPSRQVKNDSVILDSAEISVINETSTESPINIINATDTDFYVDDDDIAYDDYPTEYDEEEEEVEDNNKMNNATSLSSQSAGDDPNKASFETVAESSLMPSNFSHENTNKADNNSTPVILSTFSSRFRKVNMSDEGGNTENTNTDNSSSPAYFALDDSNNGSSFGIRLFDPKTNRLKIQAASSTTKVSTTEVPSVVENTIEDDIEKGEDSDAAAAEFGGASTLISVDDKGGDSDDLLDVQNQTPRVLKIMKTLRNMAHLKLRSGKFKLNQTRVAAATKGKGAQPLRNDLKQVSPSPKSTKAPQKDATPPLKTSFTSKVGGHLKQRNGTVNNNSTAPTPFKIPLKPSLKSLRVPIIQSPRPPVIVMNHLGKETTTPTSANSTSAVSLEISDSNSAPTTTTTTAAATSSATSATVTTTTNPPVTDGSPSEGNKPLDSPNLTPMSTPMTPYHHQPHHHPFLPHGKSPHNHAYAPTQDPFLTMDDDLSVEDFQDLHVANLMFGSKVGSKMPPPPPYHPRPRPPPPPFIPRHPPPPPKKQKNMKQGKYTSYEKLTLELYGDDDGPRKPPPPHRPYIENNYINMGPKPSPPPPQSPLSLPPKPQHSPPSSLPKPQHSPPLFSPPKPQYSPPSSPPKPQHSPPQFNINTTPPPPPTTTSTTTTTEKPTPRPLFTAERSRPVSHSPPSGSLPSLSQNVKDILPFYKEPGGIFKENKTHHVNHKNWYTAGHDNVNDKEIRPGVKYAPNSAHNSESQMVYASQLNKNDENRPKNNNMKYYPPPPSQYHDHYFHSPPQQYPFIPASAPAQQPPPPPPPPPPQVMVSHHIHHPQQHVMPQQQQIFHHPQQPVLVAHVVPSGPASGFVPLLHPPQPPPQAFMAPPTPIHMQQHHQFAHQQNPYQSPQNSLHKRVGEFADDSDSFYGSPSPESDSKSSDYGYDPELEAGIREELNDLMEKNFKSAKEVDSIALGPFSYGLDDDHEGDKRKNKDRDTSKGHQNSTGIHASSNPQQPHQQQPYQQPHQQAYQQPYQQPPQQPYQQPPQQPYQQPPQQAYQQPYQQPQPYQQHPAQNPHMPDLGRIWQAASNAHQDFINAILQIDKTVPTTLSYPGMGHQHSGKSDSPPNEGTDQNRKNVHEIENTDFETSDDEPEFDFGPEEHNDHIPAEFDDFPEEVSDPTTHTTNHEDNDDIEYSIPSYFTDDDEEGF